MENIKKLKMERKILISLIIIVGIILVGSISYVIIDNMPKPIDCSKPLDVIYMKANEISLASDTANKINGIVVIPELNRIIARSEITKCKNFDYSKYINNSLN
jgi:hypothetical protein